MLKINNLSKRYGDKAAVDGLSIHIRPGEIYGFIGHNGAGKTTTLRACCGLLRFDEGEILVNSHSIKEEPVLCKQSMAYIPDNPDLYEFLSGIRYLNFISDIYGISREDREERIHRYAEQFGLTDALATRISAYSHGCYRETRSAHNI